MQGRAIRTFNCWSLNHEVFRMVDVTRRLPSSLAIAVFLTAAVSGCIPLPIPHRAFATPKVTGVLRSETGAPIAGMRVAAARSPAPKDCAWSDGADVSDSLGRFQLPVVYVRKRILLVSLFENFGMVSYTLCARPPDTVSIDRQPLMADIAGRMRGDSVDCLLWHLQGSTRLTCDTERAHHIVVDGAWSEGASRGTYRLITAPTETDGGSEYRAIVQWLELDRAGRPAALRGSVELPAPAVDMQPAPALTYSAGRWIVVVKSNRPRKRGDERFLRFRLGPPGIVQPVPAG